VSITASGTGLNSGLFGKSLDHGGENHGLHLSHRYSAVLAGRSSIERYGSPFAPQEYAA
jgi:hypothetical protein